MNNMQYTKEYPRNIRLLDQEICHCIHDVRNHGHDNKIQFVASGKHTFDTSLHSM